MSPKIIILSAWYFLFSYLFVNVNAQQLKYTFFDFKQDSLHSRSAQITLPVQGQSGSISNSLVIDYVRDTRISLSTGIIASKNDSLMAIHSLFNGIGNFTGETETPIFCYSLFSPHQDFIGFSFNPRVSTVISTGNVFEKSTLNGDLGFNTIFKVSGDLGNISLKLIFRNSFAIGNYQFLEKLYKIRSGGFYYNSLQLKLKASQNVFLLNIPLVIIPINSRKIGSLPVYAGFGLNF